MYKKVLAAALFTTLFLQVHSQETGKSLRNVLRDLEDTYGVTFTFADDVIAGRTIETFPDIQTLAKWLKHLTQKTNLIFQPVADGIIAIRPRSYLCGRLVDEHSGQPVPYAAVAYKYEAKEQVQTTASNNQGYFEIKSTKVLPDSIWISHVAYEPLAMSVHDFFQDSCNVLQMRSRLTSLSEIIISNYPVPGISKTRSGSYVMNPQEQQILPGLTEPDVLFSLQALPGIKSAAESVSDINIRGGTNDQNLVLWDNMRMYQTGHFFGLISVFNPYIIDRVRLTKNGTSAAYGNGVSGTIDISTSEGEAEGITGGAGTNLLHSDIHLNLPLSEKISLTLAGRRAVTDFFPSTTYKRYSKRAFQDTEVPGGGRDSLSDTGDFYFYDLHARIDYRISDRDQLRINALRIFNRLEYTETATTGGVTESLTSNLSQASTAAGFFFRHRWNSKVKTDFNVYLSTYHLGAVNQDIPNLQELIQENNVINIRFSGEVHLAVGPELELLGGYAYDQIGVGDLEELNNPVFRRDVRNVLDAHVFYGESVYSSPDKKSRLQTGVRINFYPQIDHLLRVEPRLAYNYQLNSSLSFELLGEMKNQTVSQLIDLQNDFLGVEKRRWALANGNDIPVIRSQQLSVGSHFSRNEILISLEAYFKQVDGITTSSQAFQNQYALVRSSGSYTVGGIDLLAKQAFGSLTVWCSYSIAENNYMFEDLMPTPFPNNLDIRHYAFVGSSYKAGPFQSSVGVHWHSGRPFTQPEDNDPVVNGQVNYRKPNSTRVGGYLRMDISSAYKFAIGKQLLGQVGVSAWNLTNQRNVIDSYYRLPESDGDPVRVDRLALGFTPNATFRVWF